MFWRNNADSASVKVSRGFDLWTTATAIDQPPAPLRSWQPAAPNQMDDSQASIAYFSPPYPNNVLPRCLLNFVQPSKVPPHNVRRSVCRSQTTARLASDFGSIKVRRVRSADWSYDSRLLGRGICINHKSRLFSFLVRRREESPQGDSFVGMANVCDRLLGHKVQKPWLINEFHTKDG